MLSDAAPARVGRAFLHFAAIGGWLHCGLIAFRSRP